MAVYAEQRQGRPPIFVAEITINGKRHRKRFPSRKEAAQWVAILKAGGGVEALSLSLGEAIALCRREREDWRSPKDRSLGQRLGVLIEHFGAACPIETVDSRALQTLVNTLRERTGRRGALSAASINRYLATLSAIFDHCRRRGSYQGNPVIPWQKEGVKRFEWFTVEQEDALVRLLPQEHALIVRVLCSTGLRAGELWGLTVPQVEDKWIRLWETKSGTPRSVPISPTLSGPLMRLIEGGLPPYRQHYRFIKSACKSLGLSDKLTVHSMRHTTATRLAAEVPGPVVQKFLGHADYRTTERYVHLSDLELQKASDAIQPSIRLAATS